MFVPQKKISHTETIIDYNHFSFRSFICFLSIFCCPSPIVMIRLLIFVSVCFLNRNDELGIPFSVVIDEDTIDLACIGVRHRDSTLKVRENIIHNRGRWSRFFCFLFVFMFFLDCIDLL